MKEKRTAIVTGASSGLGREFARKIGEMGLADEIWLIARRKENLERLAETLSVKTRILPLDLLDDDSFAALDKLLTKENPNMSLLINNAGRGTDISFAKEDMTDMRDTVRLNAEVPVKLTRLCLPYMKRGGGIINVCSAAAFVSLPGLLVYSASKSFLLSFSRSLGRELKGRRISVTALCPYWIEDTELMEKAGISTRPLGMLNAEDVAKRGLWDNSRVKEISIPGVMGRLTRLSAALFPLPVLLFFKKLFRA